MHKDLCWWCVSCFRCYTSYCPGNSWEYEDRGTTCGPTKTAAATASATNAGAPSHVSATPTKGTKAKGDTHQSSSAEAAASSRVNAGEHSAMIPISSLLLVVAAALSTLIPWWWFEGNSIEYLTISIFNQLPTINCNVLRLLIRLFIYLLFIREILTIIVEMNASGHELSIWKFTLWSNNEPEFNRWVIHYGLEPRVLRNE